MSEPVDIVAEARRKHAICACADYREQCDGCKIHLALADHVERLQAEVARLQKFEVQHLIRYGGGTFIPNKQTGDSK